MDCESEAVSYSVVPPNQPQTEPVRGPAVPPPVPQSATVHKGDPKLVEVSDQYGLGLYASKLGSCRVGRGVENELSNAPISQAVLSGLDVPRWSVARQALPPLPGVAGLPALMAGLFDNSA